jgi:hypothetical protein
MALLCQGIEIAQLAQCQVCHKKPLSSVSVNNTYPNCCDLLERF